MEINMQTVVSFCELANFLRISYFREAEKKANPITHLLFATELINI